MAGSPLAKLLLYTPNTPNLDKFTNIGNLQTAQDTAFKVGMGAAAGAGALYLGGLVVGGAIGFLTDVAGADAAAGAPGVLTRLLADTAGSGETTAIAKTGLAMGGVLAGAAANPGLVDEIKQGAAALPADIAMVESEFESALAPELESLPGQLAQMGKQVASAASNAVDITVEEMQELGYQFHHWFSQQFEDEFDDIGIDVHEFTSLISGEFHMLLHSEGWNDAWAEWLDEAEEMGYEASDAVEHLYEMLQPYLQQMEDDGIAGVNGLKALVRYPGR